MKNDSFNMQSNETQSQQFKTSLDEDEQNNSVNSIPDITPALDD